MDFQEQDSTTRYQPVMDMVDDEDEYLNDPSNIDRFSAPHDRPLATAMRSQMLQLQHEEEMLTQERERLRARIQQIADELRVITDKQVELDRQASKVIQRYTVLPFGIDRSTRALYGNTRGSVVNANLANPINDVPAGIHSFGPNAQ